MITVLYANYVTLAVRGLMQIVAICGVIIGIYWFDVRPQIKDILSGNYQW